MEKLKKCSKCGRELPVSEFWKNDERCNYPPIHNISILIAGL